MSHDDDRRRLEAELDGLVGRFHAQSGQFDSDAARRTTRLLLLLSVGRDGCPKERLRPILAMMVDAGKRVHCPRKDAEPESDRPPHLTGNQWKSLYDAGWRFFWGSVLPVAIAFLAKRGCTAADAECVLQTTQAKLHRFICKVTGDFLALFWTTLAREHLEWGRQQTRRKRLLDAMGPGGKE